MLVYQVPIPEPLRFLEPRETETRRMHALAEYGLDARQARMKTLLGTAISRRPMPIR